MNLPSGDLQVLARVRPLSWAIVITILFISSISLLIFCSKRSVLATNAKKAPCNFLKNGKEIKWKIWGVNIDTIIGLQCPYGEQCCWGHVCPNGGSKCYREDPHHRCTLIWLLPKIIPEIGVGSKEKVCTRWQAAREKHRHHDSLRHHISPFIGNFTNALLLPYIHLRYVVFLSGLTQGSRFGGGLVSMSHLPVTVFLFTAFVVKCTNVHPLGCHRDI